jgi:short subunit dehydrogenase-like uncharacterized protein
MSSTFLLYGANGYTGRLILRRALDSGLRPLLAGRSAAEIEALAALTGLDHRVFALDDVAALDAALDSVDVVLHAAGPFAHTAGQMVQACLRTRTHYLDITGEIEVFEWLHRLDVPARDAGVMLLPGVGFDVVPTDLLAAHLKRRLPGATRLRLAFCGFGGGISRGTAATVVESLGRGGAVRRGGRFVRVPAAWRTRTVDFGFGTRPVKVTTIPWGDVATASHSTGIGDVEVYTRLGRTTRAVLRASRPLGWLLRSPAVQRLLLARVRAGASGPGEERRARGISLIWGEAADEAGERVLSRMRTPEGYTLTAMTAVEAVRRVLAGHAPAGFQTPSLAYGPDWILDLEGIIRADGDDRMGPTPGDGRTARHHPTRYRGG